MKRCSLFLVFGLLVIVSVVACAVVEPFPTLPPPPTAVNREQPPAVGMEGGSVPAAADDAQETAVAESPSPPVATPTLAPTATPTEFPELVINPAQMPAISHDLLFVGRGKLQRWQRDGNVVALVEDDVVDYMLSKDSRWAVVSQLMASTEISNTITAVTETIGTYRLTYLNLETGRRQLLVPAVNASLNAPLVFTLSQSGKYLAFSGLGLGEPEALVLGEKPTTELYVAEPEAGLPPKKIYDCLDRCLGQLWLDDATFVFSDSDGLYLYTVPGDRPRLLKSGDTGGGLNERFIPLSWAKNARWLMMLYRPYSEGTETAIFDVAAQTMMVVPQSYFDAEPYFPEMTWMADNRIFMTRLSDNATGSVVGETYRINQDAEAVQLDESVVLTAAAMQSLAPIHWENGRFGYALFEPGHPENGLYQRVSFSEPAEQISDLPAQEPSEIVWAPDGSGAVMQVNGAMYYAPAGGALVDLQTAVGLSGHNFTWLP
ncbi:MAG: hypothetical protein CSA11_01480 [Chloroflexi bacterium]|nr:MAG: hypothetical protein CSA11_01480 [Chloroflexota bacterium]